MTLARQQPSTSRELVWVGILEENGLDITPANVRLAVIPDRTVPTEADWHSPSVVDQVVDGDGGRLRCALMVGPGGVVSPGPGRYVVWARWEAGAERPEDAVAPLLLT